MSGAILDQAAALHPSLVGDNEYLRRALSEGQLSVGWNVHWPPRELGELLGRLERSSHRYDLVREYAWAIPNDLALAALADLAPLVEIGAGGGYWTHCLRERGVDVVAYDPQLWHETEPGAKRKQRIWTEVLQRDHSAAADHPTRTLMLCWPSYRESWSDRALDAYTGSTVAYIGEGAHGCTGSERFHELLECDFEEKATVDIPQWFGMHDYLSIWRRK